MNRNFFQSNPVQGPITRDQFLSDLCDQGGYRAQIEYLAKENGLELDKCETRLFSSRGNGSLNTGNGISVTPVTDWTLANVAILVIDGKVIKIFNGRMPVDVYATGRGHYGHHSLRWWEVGEPIPTR